MTNALAPRPPLQPSVILPDSAREFVDAARSANTKRAYQQAWESFCEFCATTGATSRPASETLIAEYLTHLAHAGKKVSTIRLAVAAISAAHRSSGLSDPTKHESLKLLMAGIARTLGTAPEQKTPILRADLERLVTALPHTLTGHRDKALLLVGYAGAFRRSELVSLDVEALRYVEGGMLAVVRRSKTDQVGEGLLKPIPRLKQHRLLCPMTALLGWLDLAQITKGPLFRKVDQWEHVHPERLVPESVSLILKRACLAAGLDPERYAGHSLRSGLTTQAFADDVAAMAIRKVTGHHSDRILADYERSAGALALKAARTALGDS